MLDVVDGRVPGVQFDRADLDEPKQAGKAVHPEPRARRGNTLTVSMAPGTEPLSPATSPLSSMVADHVEPATTREGVDAAGRGDHDMEESLKDSEFSKEGLPHHEVPPLARSQQRREPVMIRKPVCASLDEGQGEGQSGLGDLTWLPEIDLCLPPTSRPRVSREIGIYGGSRPALAERRPRIQGIALARRSDLDRGDLVRSRTGSMHTGR